MIALQKSDDIRFELADFPPYSPDLVSSDYLFPILKKHLKDKLFDKWRSHMCRWGAVCKPRQGASNCFMNVLLNVQILKDIMLNKKNFGLKYCGV